MLHPFFEVPTPSVIGHRGCAGEAPENTFVSFERALAQGAHILETDVHLTRDGVPVLLHDDDVRRISNGTGLVRELLWSDLRELDAGHHFSTDGGRSHPYRAQGVRVPSFEEALRAFPGARFNLELKERAGDLPERMLEIVQRHDAAARTLLTAGDDALMQRLRVQLQASGAAIAQGACVADILEFIRSAGEGRAPRSDAMALQVPAEFGGSPLVTPELIAHAHAHGVVVHVWTIDAVSEMHRLLDLGVDGIVTDYPNRLAEVIAERRSAA